MLTPANKIRVSIGAVVAVIGVIALFGAISPRHGSEPPAGSAAANSTAKSEEDSAIREMSRSEIDVATALALKEAETSIPTDSVTSSLEPPSVSETAHEIAWPSHVITVASMASTRGQAEIFVGAAEMTDATPVVVVQLIGDFMVLRSAPPPIESLLSSSGLSEPGTAASQNWARGQVMTVVADASSGQVLDFGLVSSSDPKVSLPNPKILYQR